MTENVTNDTSAANILCACFPVLSTVERAIQLLVKPEALLNLSSSNKPRYLLPPGTAKDRSRTHQMRLLSACAAAVLGGFALAGASCSDRLACVHELQRQIEAAGGYAEASAQAVQGAFYAGGELGMVAKSFVAEGDLVLSVPVEAIVMPPTCEDQFDPDRDDAVLFLARCLLKTSNPLFKQYLAALPEETTNLYAYSEDELAEFQTTALRDMINLKKDAVSLSPAL